MNLPSDLALPAADLALYAIGKGLDPDTLGGISDVMETLSKERPAFADYLGELGPDALMSVLEEAGRLTRRMPGLIRAIDSP